MSTPYASTNPNNNANRKERIAVIGGGIAGLSFAKHLTASGGSTNFECTVFDTGRLRPGGRCSSRQVGDQPKEDSDATYPILSKHIIDHAAQILSVPDEKGYEAFQSQVDQWEVDGVVRKYPEGAVCDILTDRKYGKPFYIRSINAKNDKPMYYGANGMGSIPADLAKSGGNYDIKQDVWVSPSNGVKYQRGDKQNWKLQVNGRQLGTYDQVIIAHNGKCADRLMSKTPAKDLHSLLRVNFSANVPKWGGKRMTLNSIYSLAIAVKKNSSLSKALPANKFVCGIVKNEPTLRLISCNSRKYENGNSENEDVEVWTILSSATFAKKHKGPQEFLPPDTVANVTSLMLEAVEKSLGLEASSLAQDVIESRVQLWGAAVPLNVWKADDTEGDSDGSFLYDGEFGAGVCGDWLLQPSIAGAWESGRRLAEFMKGQSDHPSSAKQKLGLAPNGKFEVSEQANKAGIGALR